MPSGSADLHISGTGLTLPASLNCLLVVTLRSSRSTSSAGMATLVNTGVVDLLPIWAADTVRRTRLKHRSPALSGCSVVDLA